MHTNSSHPPTAQNIINLLEGIIVWPIEYPVMITGLSSDNRDTKPGDLFISYTGPKIERPNFIADAVKKGVIAVLKESDDETATFEKITASDRVVPIYTIPKLKEKVGIIAARFFQNPSKQLKIIGITGTNGKTSCSQFIARILNQTYRRCGVIGTLGYGVPDELTSGALTTPAPIALQSILADFKKQGMTEVTMEVSSHSLVQHRVAGLSFEAAVFTNLTRDHLDYHGDMENYAQAKRLLFMMPHLKKAIINADDAFGQQLLTEFKTQLTCYAYTTADKISVVPTTYVKHLKLHPKGFTAQIFSPWGESEFNSNLLGRFNVSNLLAVLTTLCALGSSFQETIRLLEKLPTVPGRMQSFGGGKQPLVIVDYAHTPDALEKALTALREHCHQKLWCIFGCGGNRDQGKRAEMAQIAEKYSDHVIVTDDNPRFENYKFIMDDILKGFINPAKVTVEHDRKQAIAYAMQHAKTDDCILVAGKGHETYQQIGDIKIPFSDAEEVQKLLQEH